MKNASALPVARLTLRALKVFVWVYGALILALLLVSFHAEGWTWRALGVDTMLAHEHIVVGMRSIMIIGILSVPIAFVVFSQLLRIVDSVGEGQPFTLLNAQRLRIIAWSLLALEALHFFVTAIASAVSTKEAPLHVGGDFDLTAWVAILLLFVLAQVFLKGAQMREDLEGTI